MRRRLTFFILVFLQIAVIASPRSVVASQMSSKLIFGNIIPLPVSVEPTNGIFTLAAGANIYVESNTPEISAVGQYLADKLNPSTGFNMKVLPSTGAPANGNIYLTTLNGDSTLGDEGYRLTITPDLVTLGAYTPTGLFRGIQTIRQLLPPLIESSSVQLGPWQMATGTIRDTPRFAWRGYMVDVVRHFFGVDEIKRTLDLMAYYKLNHLHLHLSDEQGWRIEIKSWPKLETYGGSTEIGGGAGGYYTQADYADIVAYAQSRYITVVPEIDMPGHTNAALASYPELNCDGVAPDLYTGTLGGFSSLCVDKDITYKFVNDVVQELAAITPGPYIHIGGDESTTTRPADYVTFVNRVQAIVKSYHKQVMGWQDIAQGTLIDGAALQHWNYANRFTTIQGVKQGASVVMSPFSLGQRWAGYVSVQTAYYWDPAAIRGLPENSILGVEAPLWTEIISTRADLDRMTYPWLAGYAEIGWSQKLARDWKDYKVRLGSHGPRLTALGVNFYRSPEIPWQ